MRQPTRIQPPDTAMPSPAALRPPPTPGQLVPPATLAGLAEMDSWLGHRASRGPVHDLGPAGRHRGARSGAGPDRQLSTRGDRLVAVGVLALAVQLVVEPRGAAVLRVLSAAGKGMRLGPNQLTLRRTRWRRGWRKSRLVSGVLRYAPGQVTEDLGQELAEALGPFVVGDLLIRWEPDRDRFVLRQRPRRSLGWRSGTQRSAR